MHTSAREVTEMMINLTGDGRISIHISAREVTEETIKECKKFMISINTSTREVTIHHERLACRN